MANLAQYSEVSKTDLAERYERMKASARAMARKNEAMLGKGLGVVCAGLGGASAAAVHHVANKMFHADVAEKIPWGVAAAVDIAAVVFDGDSVTGHCVSAYAHGMSGYLSGKATEKILP